MVSNNNNNNNNNLATITFFDFYANMNNVIIGTIHMIIT